MLFNDEKEVQKAIEEDELSPRYPLDEGRTTDYLIIYALASRFVKPFHKWKAFKLGLIDKEGKVLRSPKTIEEKNSFTPLDHIILKIKRLIPKRLWYLLTAAYIFKGFTTGNFRESWDCDTEEEMIQIEQKKYQINQAKDQIEDIIKNSSGFTEEEFWHYTANRFDVGE